MTEQTVDPIKETFAGDTLALTITPIDGGTANFTLKQDGQQLLSEDYSRAFEKGDYPRQQRARIRNDCMEQVAGIDGLDVDAVGEAIEEWLNELKEMAEDVESDLAGPLVGEIIEGTKTPVRIHEAPDEQTTWHVELEFRGRTRELEFDASAMVGDSSGELANKIVHNYNEVIEPTAEDWERIRDYWVDNKQVVDRTTESEEDAITERFLSNVANRIQPTKDEDKFVNSVAGAFVDVENKWLVDDLDKVVWIDDDLFTDELETTGITLGQKGQLCINLRERDALHAKKRVASLTPGSDNDLKIWGFAPDALRVDPDRDTGMGEPASSEVSP